MPPSVGVRNLSSRETFGISTTCTCPSKTDACLIESQLQGERKAWGPTLNVCFSKVSIVEDIWILQGLPKKALLMAVSLEKS